MTFLGSYSWQMSKARFQTSSPNSEPSFFLVFRASKAQPREKPIPGKNETQVGELEGSSGTIESNLDLNKNLSVHSEKWPSSLCLDTSNDGQLSTSH